MTPAPSPAPTPAAAATTVGQAVAALAGRLADAGVPSPRLDAEMLARHVLGRSRASLLSAAAQPLAGDAAAELRQAGGRRAAREPLQLIVGSIGFRRLELEVRAGVFIPRPETEVLAGEAAARVPVGGVVVEACTGSGAVACAVADEARPATVVATDTSPAAVDLARRNAERCGLAVTVLAGDLLDPVPAALRRRVDVLVANPPYLAADELAACEPEVSAWDPAEALVAGPRGDEVSDRLVDACMGWLRPGGWLLLEVAEARAAGTARRCRDVGLVGAHTLPDLAGRRRFVLARAPGAPVAAAP